MKTVQTLFIALLVCLSFRADAQSSSKEFDKALKQFEKGDYKSSIEGFSRIISKDPNSRTYYGRGYAFFYLEKYDEALSDFKKFRTLAPEDLDGIDAISMIYFYKNDFQSLKDSVTAFMKIGSTEYNSNYYLGYANYHLGNDSTAIDYLSYHLQLEPEHQNALYTRSLAYLNLDKSKEAENDLSKLITLNPKYEQAYYLRAAMKNERNDNWGALEDINKAIELEPKNANAIEVKGDIYKSLSDSLKARDFYLKALSMQSDENYGLLYQLSMLEFYQFHNYENTVVYLNRLLKAEHNYYTSGLYLRAVANTRLNNYEAAEADFVKFRQRDTTISEVYLFWAELKYEQEDYTTALTYLKEFLSHPEELDTDDNASAFKLEGQIYLGQKKYELALKTLQKSATFVDSEDQGEIYYWMGKAYQGLNKQEEACESFRKAKELDYEDAEGELIENCGYSSGDDDEDTSVGII